MKLIKSLLLGSAAGFAAVAGAQAADLPMTKAAPVDYVRVCSVHGAGFFYIPGSDTCIKLAGRVRAEFMYQQPLNNGLGQGRNRDATGFRGRGQLDVDARTSSEWGTVRAYFRFQLTRDSGAFRASYDGPQGSSTNSNLDKAFIQFAGITAGVAQSFFDFYASAANFASAPGTSMGSDAGNTQLLAYTATFGQGFSATIAIEDRNQRNVTAGVGVGRGYYAVAGERMPDVVAALRVDQGWGSAQLSGAVRQLNASTIYGDQNFGSRVDTEWGYAIQAGVKINLPALAAGDALWLQAAYAEGGLNYLGISGPSLGTYNSSYIPTADAVLINGQLEKTKGWNVLGNFIHYWTPSLRSTLFGSFWQLDYGSKVTNNTVFRDYKIYQGGSALIWSPVKAMDIGVEVLYARFDPSRRWNDSVYQKSSEDQWQGRIRFQRDF
ncbi:MULTISPECIES: porin [unclassified Chelatococcus]|uniref:porin n=1 Tax=unclassified Chelatococcus TaxID=2638111 RepID=UPI001BCBF5A8|nr:MULTISPECIES: porin [unclassified Chelatococcus]CAH1651578.1 Porin [Hyphomicrobiales bacterium]MBS7739876.1 porin [Chelatococcus sp. HY11]MBX3545520.1 porin [Chelatococcus sp.]MCO5078825.1 porin [Chelatococcus sp.]CAH1686238.1 Porin [Hyphomicrobiales bacterium]